MDMDSSDNRIDGAESSNLRAFEKGKLASRSSSSTSRCIHGPVGKKQVVVHRAQKMKKSSFAVKEGDNPKAGQMTMIKKTNTAHFIPR